MDELSKAFRSWMDDLKLSALDLSKELHIAEQTIHNWRSSGIPFRRHDQVRKLMAAGGLNGQIHNGNSLTVRLTDQQFDSWNRAAMAQHKTIREWALDGLDALAAEHLVEHPSYVPGSI